MDNFSGKTEEIRIIAYQAEYQPYFEKLNKAWLNKYFSVEPVDEYVLGNPEEAILKDGGRILFAEYNGVIIGTVALKKLEYGVMELTKMAVDEKYQGLGAGKLLCYNAVVLAKELNTKRLILYSQKILGTALAVYRKNGFKEIPMESHKYKRADVMMELIL